MVLHRNSALFSSRTFLMDESPQTKAQNQGMVCNSMKVKGSTSRSWLLIVNSDVEVAADKMSKVVKTLYMAWLRH